MIAAHVSAGVLNGVNADDLALSEGARRRSGASRRVRAGAARAYDALARRCSIRPASRAADGGRWPSRSSGSTIRAPCPVLLDLVQGDGQLTRSFAARGLWPHRRIRGRCTALLAIAENAGEPLAVRIQAIRGLAAIGDARGGAAHASLIVSTRRSSRTSSSEASPRSARLQRSRRGRIADRPGVRTRGRRCARRRCWRCARRTPIRS